MPDYTVTISGDEREDGEAPYTYVVRADSEVLAVNRALREHGPAFNLRLESVEIGVPPDDCGYHWNDCRLAEKDEEELAARAKRAKSALISAAPELLSSLKRLLGEWEEAIAWEESYMGIADHARKAIAKAEGKSK